MSSQIPTTQTYIQRVQAVAMIDPQRATLTVRSGSGHTKLLIVAVGSVKHTVVQLAFRLHKTFNALVRLAQDWLAGYKALFAPVVAQVVALLPETCSSTAKSTTEMLAIAKNNLPPSYKSGAGMVMNGSMYRSAIDMEPTRRMVQTFNPGSAL